MCMLHVQLSITVLLLQIMVKVPGHQTFEADIILKMPIKEWSPCKQTHTVELQV